MSSLLPQGAAGGSLLVTPDLLSLHVPSNGILQWPLAIPNTLALATQTLRQQVVAFELTTPGAIAAVTSANALVVTIGDF